MTGRKHQLDETEFLDEEIIKFLEVYTAKTVKEEQIEETIDVLREYMPRQKEKFKFVKLVKNEITYVTKLYWILSMAVLILGMFSVTQYNLSAYEVLLYISPISMILGIFVMKRGKKEKMWELEKSFKYSISKIIMARMLIIISFTCMINMILTLVLYEGQERGVLLRLMATWIAPICILFSLNMLILYKVSTSGAIMLSSILWCITLVVGFDTIVSFLQETEVVMVAITMVISIAIFLVSVLYFCKKTERYEEELVWN